MLISKYGNGSEELVREFEGKYGIVLDEEYCKFLVKYNGGVTPNTHVGIRGCSTDLRYLYGINTEESIEDHLQIPVWENKQYLPIGTDFFGNYFVIGLSDENKGKVFFCNHERGFAVKHPSQKCPFRTCGFSSIFSIRFDIQRRKRCEEPTGPPRRGCGSQCGPRRRCRCIRKLSRRVPSSPCQTG